MAIAVVAQAVRVAAIRFMIDRDPPPLEGRARQSII